MGVNGLDINLTEVYHIQTNSLEPDQHFEYARPSEAALRKVSRLQVRWPNLRYILTVAGGNCIFYGRLQFLSSQYGKGRSICKWKRSE